MLLFFIALNRCIPAIKRNGEDIITYIYFLSIPLPLFFIVYDFFDQTSQKV